MSAPVLYKILAEDGSALYGGTGRWHLPKGERPGKWMPAVKGDIALCSNGYHLIPAEGLLEWLGPTIYEAEGRGDQDGDTTKLAFREARLIRKLAWDDRTARLFGADCAARALNLWRAQYQAKKLKKDVDPRSRAAVVAARDFAEGRIDEAWSAAWSAESAALSAAGSAARSAAGSAAESAARSAAGSAAESAARSAAESAWSAERAWQLDRLVQYLHGENPKPVPLPELA